MYKNISGERRVFNVKIKGEKIDPKKNYSVAMYEYLATGGGGYSMFSDYEITREALVTDTHALSNFIEYDLKGEIPEKYTESQGRIIATNEIDESVGSIRTYKKKKKGLSGSTIIAIIIPCVAVVTILAALILMNKKGSSLFNNKLSQESQDKIY